jgi:hypothetical protein
MIVDHTTDEKAGAQKRTQDCRKDFYREFKEFRE